MAFLAFQITKILLKNVQIINFNGYISLLMLIQGFVFEMQSGMNE